jgi:hypothetical protein
VGDIAELLTNTHIPKRNLTALFLSRRQTQQCNFSRRDSFGGKPMPIIYLLIRLLNFIQRATNFYNAAL